MKLSSCSNTFFCKDHPFLIQLHWCLCQKLILYVIVYFWTFNSISLIFTSILLPVLYLLDYYSFIEVLNSGSVRSLTMFLFFKTVLAFGLSKFTFLRAPCLNQWPHHSHSSQTKTRELSLFFLFL